jgi:hypothetical protein
MSDTSVPVERKIYSSFAFTENEREKFKINYEIYKEDLEPKVKQFYQGKRPTDQDLKDFACYECIKHGYGHKVYKILSNPYNFSTLQLALICDSGNLCFGYRLEGGNIVIHTD